MEAQSVQNTSLQTKVQDLVHTKSHIPNTAPKVDPQNENVTGSGITGLLQLPTEIVILIVECVHEQGDVEDRSAFRSTCKLLEELCSPGLFKTFSSEPKEDWEFPPPHIARFIQSVVLFVTLGPNENESTYAHYDELLPRITNVRDLTIFFNSDDEERHTVLFDWTLNLPRLEQLDVIAEGWVGEGLDEPSYRVFIEEILLSNASHLRSIGILDSPLEASTLRCLERTSAPLTKISIESSLPEELAYIFRSPGHAIWRCTETLVKLDLLGCAAIHAAHFTNLVVKGIYKALRILQLSACGADDDDPDIPVGSFDRWNLSHPCLDKLTLDHFLPWELAHYSRIRTKELWISRIDEPNISELLGSKGVFQGLECCLVGKETQKESPMSEEEEKKIQHACDSRKVRLEFKDELEL